MMRKRVMAAWGLAGMWMGVIWGLSSIPGREMPQTGFNDILAPAGHFMLYFVLAGLLYRAQRKTWKDMPSGRALILAVVLAVVYGVVDEFHQSFVPGRNPSVQDVLVDGLGALGFAAAARFRGKNIRAKH